jgi:hypothetical protein
MRNLGKIAPPLYPLLPKCSECGRRSRNDDRHWPFCPKAPAQEQAAYLQAMRDHPSWRNRG